MGLGQTSKTGNHEPTDGAREERDETPTRVRTYEVCERTEGRRTPGEVGVKEEEGEGSMEPRLEEDQEKKVASRPKRPCQFPLPTVAPSSDSFSVPSEEPSPSGQRLPTPVSKTETPQLLSPPRLLWVQ